MPNLLEHTDERNLTGTAAENAPVATEADSLFQKPQRRISEAHVAEAAHMLHRAWSGDRRATLAVEEAFTTNDFVFAAFVVLDRETLDVYQELPANWTQYCYQTSVRDFRPKTLVDLTQSGFSLLPVAELDSYKDTDRTGGRQFQISVSKFGRKFGFSFEAGVNDQLGELQDVPEALARAAADRDNLTAVSLLTKGNGPDPAYFKNWTGDLNFGNVNNAPDNKPLSSDNLDAAVQTVLGRIPQKDADRAVIVPRLKLVIPQSLKLTAERIMAQKAIVLTDTSSSARTGLPTGTAARTFDNYLVGLVDIVVDPWLTVVDKGTKAAATWYLVPDPQSSNVKPFAFARLRGHEAPELRVKSDTGVRIGGGDIPAQEGNFDNDAIEYRVRHINGGAQLDPTFTYVSVGS